MSFRGLLQGDIDDVFLDLDEFAREIEFNGGMVSAVVDDSHAPFDAGAATSGFSDVSGLALQERTLTLYIKDCPSARISPEQAVTVDGESYIAREIRVEDELLRRTLARG
jgi:hypothetical protein